MAEAPARPVVAVTGATGFVGRHVVRALDEAGYTPRLLLRSEPAHPLWSGLKPEIVLGSLEDRAALQRLVRGAVAVVHLAGAIKATDREGFMRTNRDGARAVAEATADHASSAHFLHVSSLAAREPALSGYCESKAAGEAAVFGTLGEAKVSVLRPPAIYGPGDRETLVFFELARQPLVPLLGRPTARIALIHVTEAASALVERLRAGPSGTVQGLADGRPEGYIWREILEAASSAVGNANPRFVQVPRPLLKGIGIAASGVAALAGKAAMVNAGKLRELMHEDWSVPRHALFSPPGGPMFDLQRGFADAAAWYVAEGWLPKRRA